MVNPRLLIPAPETASMHAISYAGNCLALSAAGKLSLYRAETAAAFRISQWDLHDVQVSPCNRFVAGVSRIGDRLQVQELETGSVIFETQDHEVTFRLTPILFWGDWLLFSMQDGILKGVNLEKQHLQFASDSQVAKSPFFIEHLIDLGQGILGIIGYPGRGERSDFVWLKIDQLLASPQSGFMAFTIPKEEYLLSDVCVVAPFQDGKAIVYQDFGEEILGEDEENFNGFTILNLANEEWTQMLPYFAQEVAWGQKLMITNRFIALGRKAYVDIIARDAPHLVQHIPALFDHGSFFETPYYAFNHQRQELAVRVDGGVEIYHLG